MLLLLLLLLGVVSANHLNPTGCGTHADPICASFGCYCECVDGYCGYSGGRFSSTQGEHICGKVEQNCPGCGFYPVLPPGPCSVDRQDCSNHCSYPARETLCNGHGFNRRYYQRVLLGDINIGRLADIETLTETCQCDPGYFGITEIQEDDGEGCNFGLRRTHCTQTVRAAFCSSLGDDPSGPIASANPQCQPVSPRPDGIGFSWPASPTCGVSYSTSSAISTSSNVFANLVCLCGIGQIGGSAGQTGQCSASIASTICSGHGAAPIARFPANTPASLIDCTCNTGFVDLSPTQQCAVFEPCAKHGCTPLQGTCGLGGISCVCNTTGGYANPRGGACCPLKFGDPTNVCNGLTDNVCTNEGTCPCPFGKDPGCCLGCDDSQQCLKDGRCACPVLGGRTCGAYGTCVPLTVGGLAGAVLNCTCNRTLQVDVDGPSGPILPVNITYGGKFCCPIIGNKVCGPTGGCSSTPHPDDPQTGGCVWPTSVDPAIGYKRAGRFGCPIVAGQSKECGVHGVCQTNGVCWCPSGFPAAALACEINPNCNPSSQTTECSGSGTCDLNTGGTAGLGSYLQDLRFDDIPNKPYETSDSMNFTDDGAVEFLRRLYQAFYGFDPRTKPQESTYYTANVSVCAQTLAAGGSRGLCLWNMLTACHPPRDAYRGTFGSAELYVEAAFKQLHPARIVPPPAGTPNEPYMLRQTEAFLNNCLIATTGPREAMASLLAWELWLQLYKIDTTAFPPTSSITLLPSHVGTPYHCRCTPPDSMAQIGITKAAGGPRCQFQCLVGGAPGDLQVCSGFRNGVLRGVCTGPNAQPPGTEGTCECGPRFAGPACQYSLEGKCFPVSPNNDAVACSGTTQEPNRRGTCRQQLIPGADPLFSCNCTAQFDGAFCQLSRCQAPGDSTAPGECNGKGRCNVISTGVFRCDCSSYLTTLYDTGSGNIVPFLATGNACERNGTRDCANFKQAAGQPGGVGNWQVCSGRGTCSWNYNTETGTCVCQSGYSGSRCQNTLCAPDCNANQTCDPLTGTCGCLGFHGNPQGCAAGNRTCECSQNLCDHGVPTADGSSCVCDAGWKKVVSGPTAGRCSVVQCRLVVHTDQGVRPCAEPQDQRCPDLLSITQSLQQGCCVDTCPLCILNQDNTRSCVCDSLSGGTSCYDSGSEMCLPKCHGNDVLHPNPPNCDSSTNPITCHCQHVALTSSQFVDLRCQRYTCLNGGLRTAQTCNPNLQQCCDCSQTAYSGSFCASSICGDRGTPFPNGTRCDCIPPFKASSATGKDCNADSCSPGVVATNPGSMSKPFVCDCPGSTFVVSLWST